MVLGLGEKRSLREGVANLSLFPISQGILLFLLSTRDPFILPQVSLDLSPASFPYFVSLSGNFSSLVETVKSTGGSCFVLSRIRLNHSPYFLFINLIGRDVRFTVVL